MEQLTIRKMPKYIMERVQKLDKALYPTPNGTTRFYAYLAIWNKELVKVTVAVKNKYKKFFCKQVALHGLHFNKCFVKDMEYCNYIGMGYRVGWHAEGLSKRPAYFEINEWQYADDKYYDPYAKIINSEVIEKLPEFKYSAYKLYNDIDILNYLRLYEKYPQTEYILKLGLQKLVKSKLVLNLISKDKSFIKWLSKNRQEITSKYLYIPTIIKSFKTGKSLREIQFFEESKKLLQKDSALINIKELFKDKNLKQLFTYIYNKNTNLHTYLDYINACNYLSIDLNLENNLFPKNFNRAHDNITLEYEKAKKANDKIEREKLYKQFYIIASKYKNIEKYKDDFSIILPNTPDDLKYEGEALNHCVGRMDYDQKFIKEESLILFLRQSQSKEKPYVTIEFSLTNKKLLQVYGYGNTKPDSHALDFVNKVWLPYAKRKINKITG